MWMGLGFAAILMSHSPSAIEAFAFALALSVVVDIVTLGTFTSKHLKDQTNPYHFAFASQLLALLLKPFVLGTCFFEYLRRGGAIDVAGFKPSARGLSSPPGQVVSGVPPSTSDGTYQQI